MAISRSSLVQVADAICYVYRRFLELKSADEEWEGEEDYYVGLVAKLEPAREKLGRYPDTQCTRFYEKAKHTEWKL